MHTMCGVFGLSKNSLDDRYMSQFNPAKYLNPEEWNDRYNIRPTQQSPIIYQTVDNNRLELAKFGLIPAWAKTEKMEFPTFNARSETVDQLPTYRKPFKEKRCIIPADFFGEFLKTPEGSDPYLFKLKGTDKPMWFAGVYDVNEVATDKPILSFSIITTPANGVVSPIHPRMPAILTDEQAKQWLDIDNIEPDLLKSLLTPYPDDQMVSWHVSKAINSSRSEGSDLIKPI